MNLATLSAWTRKELREQLPLLIGNVLALSLLTVLFQWLFDLRKLAVDQALQLAMACAAGLYLVSVASQCFAKERNQGTLALIQRLPRALIPSLVGKGISLLIGISVVLACQVLTVKLTLWIAGPIAGMQTSLDPSELLFDHWAEAGIVLVGITWVALSSLLIPRSGAAAITAPMLLALILLPLMWFLREHPLAIRWKQPVFFFDLTVAMTLLATAAMTWGYLRGWRTGRSQWPAVWRVCAVLLVASVGGTATGAWSYVNRPIPSLDQPDIHFRLATISTNERYAYLNVDAPPWLERYGAEHGLPIPFVLDLRTGEWEQRGTECESFYRQYRGSGHFYTPHILSTIIAQTHIGETTDRKHVVRWFDTDRNQIVATSNEDVRPTAVHQLQRDHARLTTHVFDDQGQPLWLAENQFWRGTQPIAEVTHRPRHGYPIPGGWYERCGSWCDQHDHPSDRGTGSIVTIYDPDAEVCHQFQDRGRGPFLSPRTQLLPPRRFQRRAKIDAWSDGDPETWRLCDNVSGENRPALEPPQHQTAEVRGVLAPDRVLIAGDGSPYLWDPETGERWPVDFTATPDLGPDDDLHFGVAIPGEHLVSIRTPRWRYRWATLERDGELHSITPETAHLTPVAPTGDGVYLANSSELFRFNDGRLTQLLPVPRDQ